MVVDCPGSLKGQKCFLRFKRNNNDIKTKESEIDGNGLASFNEKIEMKTMIEFDNTAGRFKNKMAQL